MRGGVSVCWCQAPRLLYFICVIFGDLFLIDVGRLTILIMDPEAFLEMANQVTKLKMFPYFDIAHCVICCLYAREDIGSGEIKATSLAYRNHGE